MRVDLPLDQLVRYEYPHPEPGDFDAFWSRTLREQGAHPLDPRFEPVDALVRTVDVYDVTFAGYAGDEVRGWLLLPHERTGPLPLVVEYLGYGSGRGHPVESLAYASRTSSRRPAATSARAPPWLRPVTAIRSPATASWVTTASTNRYASVNRRR